MKSKLFFLTKFFAFSLVVACTQKTEIPADQKMKVFIDDLMKKMTLEEKIGQLNLPASEILSPARLPVPISGKKSKKGKVGGLFKYQIS